jgi:hypothetical protein
MKRAIVIAALFAAGCSGGEEAPAPKQEKAAAAAAMSAGQWTTASEVTRFSQADKGAPRINTPVGTKASGGACLGAGDAKKPNPALFVGDGYDCTYRDSYMSAGTISANLECKRAGLSGLVMVNVSGSYTADTFDAEVATITHLATDGDVQIGTKVTGRRSGECTAQ